ncbi:hypothetical protein QIA34_04880 [Borreliella yangtzensis]
MLKTIGDVVNDREINSSSRV